MKLKTKPKNINEYIAAAPKPAQKKLREIRAALRTIAPHTQEGIKWGMPAFTLPMTCSAAARFR